MRIQALAPIAAIGFLITTAPATHAEDLAFADRPGVASEVLQSMRGGFTTTVGGALLELSFGIERVISVNGEVAARTSLQLPSLHQLDALRAVSLLQGTGNNVAADLAGATSLHVIQNTLDNQTLRQITTINASVRNLELHRAVQFGALLNRQLSLSVR